MAAPDGTNNNSLNMPASSTGAHSYGAFGGSDADMASFLGSDFAGQTAGGAGDQYRLGSSSNSSVSSGGDLGGFGGAGPADDDGSGFFTSMVSSPPPPQQPQQQQQYGQLQQHIIVGFKTQMALNCTFDSKIAW